MRKILLFIMIVFFITGCNPFEEQSIDLQIEPSKIPSVLMVGESIDLNFSYLEYEDVAEKVKIWTDTPNIISIEDSTVTALEPGIAKINIKYPKTINSGDYTNIYYNDSTTQISVFEGRVSKDWIRETSEMINFSRGTNYEDLLELKFSEYQMNNNSEIIQYSDDGRIILYEGSFFIMTFQEIIDKNPEHSLEGFIIDEIQFEYPDLLHIKGFNKTYDKIVETPNWTDSGVKNNLMDRISYDCGNERTITINLEGTIKHTSSTDNEVCKE